jgi:hypothetical protein
MHNSDPTPQSVENRNILLWFKCVNNYQFLQYDNGQNAENRMLVFYSPESLERLANAQTFFIFMYVPSLYLRTKQQYTIRVPFKDATGTHTREQSEVVVVLVERHQTKLLYLSP